MTASIVSQVSRRRSFWLAAARLWIFIAAVAAVSAGVWIFNVEHFVQLDVPGGITLPWWAFAIAFYIAEANVVHLQFRKQAHTLSFTELGLVLGLFFTTPGSLLAGHVVGAGLAFAIQRRQKPIKIAFNLAEISLCTGLALLIFRSFVDAGDSNLKTWSLVLVAAALAHTAGVVLVSAVISVAEGRLAAPQLARTLTLSLVGALAISCVGLVGVELLESDPAAVLLLIIPAIACGLSFRAYMAQREAREHVEFLYESMRATQGVPEFGLAVGQLLVAARRLLRADYAEIVLTSPTPGEPVLRSVSGEEGELLMHPEELGSVGERAFEYATATERAVLCPTRRAPHPLDEYLTSRGLDDAIVGPLRGENHAFGMLIVGDRVGDVSTFAEDELTLFETFAGHASVLLENGRLEHSLAQVTELKEELRNQAHHDALTGLANRVLFSERVAAAFAREATDGTVTAVLFFDLDGFKVVNDTWGHAVGDELLVQVAERIRRNVRADETPARLGGDEFAVLLEDSNTARSERAGLRLLEAFDTPFSVDGREMSIGVSLGIATSGPDATDPEELLRNADVAMYMAKADDRRHYATYEPSLHKHIRGRRQLALELTHAVKTDELVVAYQPVVSLASGAIHAFEALVRWQHPERGLMLPNSFLDIAAESNLMIEVGKSAIDQALRHAGQWHTVSPEAAGYGLWLNLAPAELANERLIEEMALALARSDFDVRRLTIEITESSVIRDERAALKAMHRLRELGARLSIDDFGTGYSSLSRLAEFPIDMLKIPKPFVDRLIGDEVDPSFVDAILRLAGSLGLEVVAEGVEHPEQARRLRELGCDLAQGYLFSRAIGADELPHFLRSHSGRVRNLLSPPSASGDERFPDGLAGHAA